MNTNAKNQQRLSFFFISFFVIIIFLTIISCNNEKKEPAAAAAEGDTAKAVTTTTVIVPRFRINASQLPVVSGGVASLNPRKFLIRTEMTDINQPLQSLRLLLYPAADHPHYGRNTIPIETINAGNETLQNVTSVVIGNNELPTGRLVGSPPQHNTYFFHYLIFIPKIITGTDNKNHLVFAVKAYDSNGIEITTTKDGQVVILAISDTNPSPPADPSN